MKKLRKKNLYFLSMILLITSCSTNQIGPSEKQLSKLKQTDWTELSEKYDSSYFEGEMQSDLSSETLAEWWTILEDDTL